MVLGLSLRREEALTSRHPESELRHLRDLRGNDSKLRHRHDRRGPEGELRHHPLAPRERERAEAPP